jgi:Fe2+ transport system protein FeoA
MSADAPQNEPLSALPIGQKARVVAFNLAPEQRQRFLEMGMTVGVEIQIVRFAPLGDPLEIKVRGSHLSLRKKEAAGVLVARI